MRRSAAILLLLMLSLPLGPVTAQQAGRMAPSAAPGYQLLANPGMEVYDAAYGQFAGVDCQVASGWQRFWHDSPEPCWIDTRVFADSHLGAGWVERIQGETSQLIISTEPYTAGLWQRVSGLTPGVAYGFHAAMLTIFQTSAPPAVDGTMIKQVGIDPGGGTDPRAPTVVWSAPDGHDEGPWDIEQRVAVRAQAPAMTVFVRVISPYPAGDLPYLNYSFLDSAILAQAPTVSASSPSYSQEPAFTVTWDNVVPAPEGGKIRWYDVQWLDEAEGIWRDWLSRTREVRATFTGQQGRTYRFRARAWQRYPNGAHLWGPWPPEGDTVTAVGGSKLAGRVLTSAGQPVVGATVAISGTAYAASSDASGRYDLDLEPWSGARTVIVSHPWWASPPPVHGLTLGPAETAVLTWTLRPPDDAMANGGFETGLAGWSPLAGPGFAPAVVAEPVHTGRGALALGATTAGTSGVTQTAALTGVWEPVLSFWYHAPPEDTGSVFNVRLTLVTAASGAGPPVTATRVFTPGLAPGDWRHQWYYLGPPHAVLTGTVTVEFRARHASPGGTPAAAVVVDEVSLGAAPGGPYRLMLPLVVKGAITR